MPRKIAPNAFKGHEGITLQDNRQEPKVCDCVPKTCYQIRGFPSVFFCTAKTDPDEQEKTRLLLLSPATDQEKLKRVARTCFTTKGRTPEEYRKRIDGDPERAWLIKRIYAMRQWGIREIVIPDNGKCVYDRFMKEHTYLITRHQRDFPRIFGFIKAHTLLNCFNREKTEGKPDTIMAIQTDIDAGFQLYKEIEQSNELGLSPYVYRVYKDIIEPQLDAAIGLTRKQIRQKYYTVFHKTLTSKFEESIILQDRVLPSLIQQEPDPDDKRQKTSSTPLCRGIYLLIKNISPKTVG